MSNQVCRDIFPGAHKRNRVKAFAGPTSAEVLQMILHIGSVTRRRLKPSSLTRPAKLQEGEEPTQTKAVCRNSFSKHFLPVSCLCSKEKRWQFVQTVPNAQTVCIGWAIFLFFVGSPSWKSWWSVYIYIHICFSYEDMHVTLRGLPRAHVPFAHLPCLLPTTSRQVVCCQTCWIQQLPKSIQQKNPSLKQGLFS